MSETETKKQDQKPKTLLFTILLIIAAILFIIFFLILNESAKDFQFLDTKNGPLYEQVALAAVEWSKKGEIGIVVGATKPDTMKKFRDIVGDMPILLPGVGAQGGDIKRVVRECGSNPGSTIINSSRNIIYASKGHDFSNAARSSLENLRNIINTFRE